VSPDAGAQEVAVARDLFADVAHSSMKVGSRAGYTVPLSIVTHIAVATIVIFGPLLAPTPSPVASPVMALIVPTQSDPPSMPPAPRSNQATRTPVTASHASAPGPAAPATAPDNISRARDEVASVLASGPVVASGIPGPDVGSVPGVGTTPQLPPSPPPSTPVRTGGQISNPAKTKDVRPVYPAIAVANRVQGTVTIEAIIGTDGRVKDARIVQSIPLLDQSALAAVLQWQFRPTLLNGIAVPVIMSVTVNFTLH